MSSFHGYAFRQIVICSLLVASTFTPTSGCFAKDKPKSKPGDAKVEVGTVIKAIEDALKEDAKSPVEGFPRLQSVTVTAQTTITKEVGAGIKFYIVNLGGQRTYENAATVTFELKPPPEASSKFQPSSINPEELKSALARQIQLAKVGFVSAKDNAKTLKTDKVEIQIAFTVSTQGTGGIDTGSILPIGITADGKLQRDIGNTITLDFSDQP